MPHRPDTADRVAAVFAQQLLASARGRARTATLLQVRGPGAVPQTIVLGLTTAVMALLLLRLL